MSRVTGPVATNVRGDDGGAYCSGCLMPVILHRIDRGVPTYRHISKKPPCLFGRDGKALSPEVRS